MIVEPDRGNGVITNGVRAAHAFHQAINRVNDSEAQAFRRCLAELLLDDIAALTFGHEVEDTEGTSS